jgi:hypothetical protein
MLILLPAQLESLIGPSEKAMTLVFR